MRRLGVVLVAVAALIGLAASCGDDGGSDGGSDAAVVTVDDLAGRRFQSTSVEHPELVGDTRILMTFDRQWVSYAHGCNSFSAPYRLDGGHLQLTAGVSGTFRSCAARLERQDRWLNRFLIRGPAVALDGATLTLTSNGDTVTFLEV